MLNKLEGENYYLLLRLKLNNSAKYRYYTLDYSLEEKIEYYTIAKNDVNYKLNVDSSKKDYKKHTYNYIKIKWVKSNLK